MLDNTVTLVGGNGTHQGNVFLDGMPICDYTWDLKDAWVVCKQLGFASVLDFTRNSFFGRVNNLFRMRYVNCKGNESSLAECPHTKVGSCSSYSGAGVKCSAEFRSMFEICI